MDGTPSERPAPRGRVEYPLRALTDLGNAERLADRHRDDLRWSEGMSGQVWDERRWRIDDTLEVDRRAKTTVRSIWQECNRKGLSPDERKDIAEWAEKSEKAERIKAMVGLARSDAEIAVRVEDFDRDPMLLNCRNGTLDLRERTFRPHARADLLTKLAPVDYAGTAKAPVFERFLRDVFVDAEVIAFVLRYFGSALTGDVSDQRLLVCHGTGSNGKSTLLGIFADVLGDYQADAPPHLLMARRHEAHPTERTIFRGARLVSTVEVAEGRRWNEELVKQLTGGDAITARYMRRDFFTFKPTHKLVVACNHLPMVRGDDHAIWRRMLVLPFDVQFLGDKLDKAMPQKLAKEAPGILRMLVDGCYQWQERGLDPPASVQHATARYREGEDTIARFIVSECVIGPECRAPAKPLYDAYVKWCAAEGEGKPISMRAFGESMDRRGFEGQKERGRGPKIRHGIGLLHPERANDDGVPNL